MYRRGEVSHVARALRILNALRGFKLGRTLADLAAAVGVTERTVRRDLVVLNNADIEIELTRVDHRAAACLVEASYSTVAITRRERYSLLAARSMFDVLRGTPLAEDIASVLGKLEQQMTDAERLDYVTFGDRFAYVPDGGTKIYDKKEDVVDALLTGVLQRKLVKVSYRGARGRARSGYLAPYSMVVHKHGLYVLGSLVADPDDIGVLPDRPTVFAAERFDDAEHLRRYRFSPPPTYRLATALHGAFGIHVGDPKDATDVEIEFSKERATYARSRIWHPSQTIKELANGRVQLRFTCVNLTPVVSWVLEWGPHARAMSPPALVDMVIAELDAARAQYPWTSA